MPTNSEDIKRQVEIDQLLTLANVYRIRAEYIQAEDLLRKILEFDPARVEVHELLADTLYARGQLSDAAQMYKKVLEMDNNRTSAETKYARTVLEIGEMDYTKRLTQEMIDNPHKYSINQKKSPLMAFLLSVFLPGAGQLLNQEIVKGAIVIGSFLFSVLVLALSPVGTKNLIQSFLMIMSPGAYQGSAPPVGGLVMFFASVVLGIYIYGVVDAFVIAGKSSKSDSEEPLP